MSKVVRKEEQHLLTEWEAARRFLKIPTESTRNMYIGPNGLRWDLSGRHKGRQGVTLGTHLQGDYHQQFEQLFTEGAYQIGATYERTNLTKKVINLAVTVGYNRSASAYRQIESNWWDSWPLNKPGWWGRFTPTTGWRWTQVMLAKTVDTEMPLDPTAFGNNGMRWDMQIVAPKPWWAKRVLHQTWSARPTTSALLGEDEYTFHIANRGTLESFPKFIYSGPGRCWVQDGNNGPMVEVPQLSEDDGYVTCDTDPAEPTFKGSNDPIDNGFYDYIRSSRLLDFFLHDLAALGEPVWRRANGVRFTNPIPPRTVAHLKVRHTGETGQVTCLLPQRYTRPS